MNYRVTSAILGACLLTTMTVAAQRPADAPATAPSGKPPDTVMLEELTWAETRDLIKDGWTTVIIGTAGTEQKGPHMVDGEHKFVMTYTADKIARGIGPHAGRADRDLRAGRQLGDGRGATWGSPARSRCPKIASWICWSTPAAA